mgnify:CR=1 FL=1|jgi:hypothetical protein
MKYSKLSNKSPDKDQFQPVTPLPAAEDGRKAPDYQSNTPFLEDYQDVAEKVGMVPDFNTKRNLLQLAITAPFEIIGFVAGWIHQGSGVRLSMGHTGIALWRADFWLCPYNFGIDEEEAG